MRCQGRNRYADRLNHKRRLEELAETKPAASAARAFVRKAYESCDAAGYMARKYDIEGEIRIGEENSEEA